MVENRLGRGRYRGLDPLGGLSLYELSQFRTEICSFKAAGGAGCALRENCVDSHCLSWHRRNPFQVFYRPMLCPNTKFWTTEEKRMKVKTWCKRGRHCLFSHTKEEQMYHPLIYKTQICRDYPNHCSKPYCPFAHGLAQLKNPDVNPLQLVQGPEVIEHCDQSAGANGRANARLEHVTSPDDRIHLEFSKMAKEREQVQKFVEYIKGVVNQRIEANRARESSSKGQDSAATPTCILCFRDDKLQVADFSDMQITPVGLIALKLNDIGANF